MRVFQKGFILVGVPFLLAAVVVGALSILIWQTDVQREREQNTRKLAMHSASVLLLVFDAGYCVHQLVRGQGRQWMDKFKQDIADVRAEQDAVKAITATGQANIQDSEDVFKTAMAALHLMVDGLRETRNIAEAMVNMPKRQQEVALTSYEMCNKTDGLISRTLNELRQTPERNRKEFDTQVQILFGAIFAGILTAIGLARWYAAGITNRVRIIIDNTVRLTKEETLHPPLGGSDEIASVDRSFHKMAAAMKAAQARESALFDNATDMICVLDSDFKFTSINPAGAKLIGKSKESLIGTFLIYEILEDDRRDIVDALTATKTGTPYAEFESRLHTSSEEDRDVSWSVFWSDLDQALYAVAHDITEQKQLARAKQDFLAMVSHDLRSPLTAIDGSLKLLAKNSETPEQAQQKIKDSITTAHRLLELVNDLLDLDKLESGEMVLSIAPSNVRTILASCANEVQMLASAKSISIEIRCENDADFPIDGDRIAQVVVNLLSNAIKFSPENAQVDLQARLIGENLQIEVIDHGRGIPESMLGTVFERFKQVSAADGRRSQGTGLGLPICKEIVEAHGGTIEVSSREGAGSIFQILLPRERRAIVNRPQTQTQNFNIALTGAHPTIGVTATVKSSQSVVTKLSAPFNNLSIMQKGLLLVAVPLIFELVFAGTMFGMFQKIFEAKQRETHVRLIATAGCKLTMIYYRIGTGINVVPVNERWGMISQAWQESNDLWRDLFDYTKTSPKAHSIVEATYTLQTPVRQWVQRAYEIFAREGITPKSADKASKNWEEIFADIAASGNQMQSLTDSTWDTEFHENQVATYTKDQLIILAVGLATSLGICVLSAVLFGKGVTQRLRNVEINADRLMMQEPLSAELGGKDEVAQLDHFFHTMEKALREARRKERAVFDNAQDVF